jgi:hypothetical protein
MDTSTGNAAVSPPAAAVAASRYPLPGRSIVTLPKVAMPATAEAVVVPDPARWPRHDHVRNADHRFTRPTIIAGAGGDHRGCGNGCAQCGVPASDTQRSNLHFHHGSRRRADSVAPVVPATRSGHSPLARGLPIDQRVLQRRLLHVLRFIDGLSAVTRRVADDHDADRGGWHRFPDD